MQNLKKNLLVVWKMSNFQEISKKAVKLDSFLQCSLHMFLGHDGCFTNQFKNFMKPYNKELSNKARSMSKHHIR